MYISEGDLHSVNFHTRDWEKSDEIILEECSQDWNDFFLLLFQNILGFSERPATNVLVQNLKWGLMKHVCRLFVINTILCISLSLSCSFYPRGVVASSIPHICAVAHCIFLTDMHKVIRWPSMQHGLWRQCTYKNHWSSFSKYLIKANHKRNVVYKPTKNSKVSYFEIE